MEGGGGFFFITPKAGFVASLGHRMPVGIMNQVEVTACPSYERLFQEAMRRGDTGRLLALLQSAAPDTVESLNVNSFYEGETALHRSVVAGNLELVKLLVQCGADPRLATRDGWSALHIAAFGGHQDIVLYLINSSTRRR